MTDFSTDATARDAILRLLAEDGATESLTLHRIMMAEHQFSPGMISHVLAELTADNLIEAAHGIRGQYKLTERGRAAANVAPMPRDLSQATPHPGGEAFDPATGRLVLGRTARGEDVTCSLWNDIGTKPLLVSGATGAGGTNVLGGLIEATLSHPQHVRLWMIDPDEQMREYWRAMDTVAVNEPYDKDEAVLSTQELLRQLIGLQQGRSKLLANARKKGWTGTDGEPQLPLIVVVISQIEDVTGNHENTRMLASIAKMARKTGVVLATHAHSLLMQPFGYAMALTDHFAGGNILTLRHSTKPFGQIVAGAGISIPDIPREFANGYSTAGVGTLGDDRLFRTFLAQGL